ncbi:hypothetical protein [Roseiarcus sp.]|uniref:hypothetical protein n=1 Tax=Roseiarcus sp. TaxID=1969460 RepID=UPI003F9B8670
MPLTRDFRETVTARAARDPAFKTALLTEALQALLEGEVAPGLILLRDCINATVGFGALSKETRIPEKSLMRMVGPRGNPTASNLFAMVAALQHKTHTQAHVEMARRLDAMTDDDIAKAVAGDPDAAPLNADLEAAKRRTAEARRTAETKLEDLKEDLKKAAANAHAAKRPAPAKKHA